jgi:hypothetical protein
MASDTCDACDITSGFSGYPARAIRVYPDSGVASVASVAGVPLSCGPPETGRGKGESCFQGSKEPTRRRRAPARLFRRRRDSTSVAPPSHQLRQQLGCQPKVPGANKRFGRNQTHGLALGIGNVLCHQTPDCLGVRKRPASPAFGG